MPLGFEPAALGTLAGAGRAARLGLGHRLDQQLPQAIHHGLAIAFLGALGLCREVQFSLNRDSSASQSAKPYQRVVGQPGDG